MKCKCNWLRTIRNENDIRDILLIECIKCKRRWTFNQVLGFWSDSYVGTFIKVEDKKQCTCGFTRENQNNPHNIHKSDCPLWSKKQ